MFGQCELRGTYFIDKVEENVVDRNVNITWSQWINENGHAEKKEFSGSVDKVVVLLKSKVAGFLFHVFMKRQQSNYFEKLKAEVTDTKIVMQIDFAENSNMREQDEIQKAHRNTKSLSIFSAFVWSRSKTFSYGLPSLDVTHDKFVVSSALEIILNHLESVIPNVKEINRFSDGAASQFKQRFHFRNLVRITNERRIDLSWHFFAISHGKDVVDGIRGTVKRLVWSSILAGSVCRSAEDFIQLAMKKTDKIILLKIKISDINMSKTKLESIFKTVKTVPETQKMHSVTVIDNNTLELRYYSTCSEKKKL